MKGDIIMRYELTNEEWGGKPTKRLLLLFGEEQLKFDIANVAYAEGSVARVNDNYGHDLLGDNGEQYLSQWKDVCEDGNYERVRKVIGIAISECEQLLYRYTQHILPWHYSLGNRESEQSEFSIEMRVPETFSDTTCQLLQRSINEYIVATVLEDWARITLPEAQERWAMRRQEMKEKIQQASHMCGESKHKVTPSII